MKILQINSTHARLGGADVVYLDTATLLEKHNHQVSFFSTLRKENIPCKDECYFVPVSNAKGLFSKIKEAFHFFYNRKAKKNIESLILSEKPDIAHIHLIWGTKLSISILSVLRKYKIPIVHSIHDYRLICPNAIMRDADNSICEKCQGRYYYKAITSKCFGDFSTGMLKTAEIYWRNLMAKPIDCIDGFLFVSKFAQEKHMQYMPKRLKEKSVVLHNFSLNSHSFKNTLKRSYFLFYGRLSSEKGIQTVLDAFIDLPDISLLIMGSGSYEEEVKKFVAKNKMENVEILPYKTGDELKSIICNTSFVLVPSEWYENNPLVIIESYMMGVPVIGTRMGGIPEMIEDKKTGFIFNPKDVSSLKEIIRECNRLSMEEYKKFSSNAVEFFNNFNNEDKYYDSLISFYQQVIDNYQ